jgi:uncharacterized membrane protein
MAILALILLIASTATWAREDDYLVHIADCVYLTPERGEM